mmetsp:Transcript_53119/g.139312  ORF Transcript_53119/g.139312 Transcript_53119/m.139312 type:complete len:556 (+) Transcript_53119:163-1830(+)
MFDFDLLEKVEAGGTLEEEVVPASRSLEVPGPTQTPEASASADETAKAAEPNHPEPAQSSELSKFGNCGSEAAPAPEELDEDRWKRVVSEPSQTTLAKWARCESVREILRQFVLEDVVGEVEVIQFKEVYKLLELLSLTPAGLVAKFVDVPRSGADVERLADRILAKFASRGSAGSCSAMRFHDLYRMLEAVGVTIRKLLSKFVDDCADLHFLEADRPAHSVWRFGSYLVTREIGAGFRGPCCYLAEHERTRQRGAVKWPMQLGELEILQDIHKKAATTPGLPRVLACGRFDGDTYVVTDLLGSPLSKIMGRLQDHPFERKWAALRVIGRLVLRRLQAVHSCGYVHCDVSPENVLLGRAWMTPASISRHTLYLVDFGLARRSGKPLEGAQGSSEWSSIRSAQGGPRLPEDDLEALGWILVNGLMGDLPWFDGLSRAYEKWHYPDVRKIAVQQASEAKLQLLEGGWDSNSGCWRKLADVPEELDAFLKACRASAAEGNRGPPTLRRPPDYGRLLALLADTAPIEGGNGGGGGTTAAPLEAEEQDLKAYAELVVPLL